MILPGDCVEVMAGMEPESVDAEQRLGLFGVTV